MQGQWFGDYSGTNSGRLILNLDQRPDGFSGNAVVHEGNLGLPGAVYFVSFESPKGGGKVKGHADLASYYKQGTNRLLTADELKQLNTLFPDIVREALRIAFDGTFASDKLELNFATDADTRGTASLSRFPVDKKSTVTPRALSWGEFKTEIERASKGRLLYRGQPRPDPLRTSFHRVGRYDIARFAREDIQRLENAITSVTNTTFNLADARINAALLGLAQHHGYPTPLMDWTKSPYVAAYFACRDATFTAVEPIVFVFDQQKWLEHHGTILDMGAPLPALTFVEPLPLHNPRVLAQQAILAYCNVDNLENFVKSRERENKTTYLSAYALTGSAKAMLRDLRLMGVFAASLFPGLDGMCRGMFEGSLEVD